MHETEATISSSEATTSSVSDVDNVLSPQLDYAYQVGLYILRILQERIRTRQTEQILTGIFTFPLLLLAIIGNAWILFVGVLDKKIRRSSFHILLLNYSLAHICVAIICSVTVFGFLKGGVHYLRPPLFCQYVVSSNICFMGVALYTNSAMAFNRVFSMYPNNKVCNFLRDSKLVIGQAVTIWVTLFAGVWVTI